MLFKIKTKEKRDLHIVPVAIVAVADRRDDDGADQVVERRRQMYERIARGNALVEAEASAQRKWRSR